MVDLQEVQRLRKLAAAMLVGLTGAMLLFAQPAFADGRLPHTLIDFLGTLALLSGITIRLWSTLYIGGRKKTSLVTVGPYSMTRNPLYVGTTLCATGVGLSAGMLGLGVACGLMCWMLFSAVIRKEEHFLHDRFGDEFARYCATTPQFLPDLARYRDDPGSRTFDPGCLWRTLRDSSLFILAIPLTEVVEHLHATGQLPAFANIF